MKKYICIYNQKDTSCNCLNLWHLYLYRDSQTMIIFKDSKIYRYLTFTSIIDISAKKIIAFSVDSKILEVRHMYLYWIHPIVTKYE